MRRILGSLLLTAIVAVAPAPGQYGGGRGMTPGMMGPRAPKLPGVELNGPLDSALARVMLSLTPEQTTRYAQAYDSFMVATKAQRDSAGVWLIKMNEKLETGDRAAAMFYAERVQEFGKFLKDRQDKWEDGLRRWLSGDQVKAYRKWKDGEEQVAERRRREDEMRWQEAGFRGEYGSGPRSSSAPEIKTAVTGPAGVAGPALGSQAVRVGRTLYVTGQLGVDSAGVLAGATLRAQAERAFANLTAVLQASGASPRDVTSLTIYVVNYRPADVATIREAGLAYFGINAPIANVLGVQALSQDGALISIAATAVATTPFMARER